MLSPARWAAAPDIPTIDEAGLPGFQMTFWHGLWVPNGTPRDAIAKLNAAAVDALADPTVRARLAQIGQDIVPREQQTPEALGAHHKAEIEKWWPIIKAAGIKAGVTAAALCPAVCAAIVLRDWTALLTFYAPRARSLLVAGDTETGENPCEFRDRCCCAGRCALRAWPARRPKPIRRSRSR